MKFSFKDLFSKCDQIRSFVRKPKVPGSSPAASYLQKWAPCSNRPANV